MNRSLVSRCYCLIVIDMVTDGVSPESESIAVSLDARFLVSIKPLCLDQRGIKEQCMLTCFCCSTLLLFGLNPAIARQLARGKPQLNLVAVLVKQLRCIVQSYAHAVQRGNLVKTSR